MNKPFEGQVTNLKTWDHALTPEEVQAEWKKAQDLTTLTDEEFLAEAERRVREQDAQDQANGAALRRLAESGHDFDLSHDGEEYEVTLYGNKLGDSGRGHGKTVDEAWDKALDRL